MYLEKKRFALVGAAGYIAPRHMRAIKELGHDLVCAYDINDSVGIIDSISPESEFFTEFERFYEHLLLLQQDSKSKIDYIVICSPNYLHRSHCITALNLGCDVICEKPLVPNCDDLELLKKVADQTGKNIYTILQLRHHEAIKNLKKEISEGNKEKIYEVDLTYITLRGAWYNESWKGDLRKSYGVIMNIGIHFFDMLGYIFGDYRGCSLENLTDSKARGTLIFSQAKVNWFLSIDKDDLPNDIKGKKTTFRSITYDGKEIEFSAGFTDLHTDSYKAILEDAGFNLEEAEKAIFITQELNKKNK